MRFLVHTLVGMLLSAPVLAGPPVYGLLENSRSLIFLPEYSREQRQTVLNQAKMIVNEIYVHKDLKVKTFAADPAGKFSELEQNFDKMPILEFHQRLSEIFNSFHDRHTLYYLPRPYACYENFLPLNFREVKDDSGNLVLAVSFINNNEQVNKLLKTPNKVKRGDVLIGYDGLTSEEAIQREMPYSLGPNESAARHLAIAGLYYKEHALEYVPENDTVKMVFKNRQGKIYSQELPWITKRDWECLANQFNQAPINKSNKRKGVASDDKEMFYYKVLQNPYGAFGYFEILDFEPSYINASQVITRFKEILRDEFADTDGVIIDIRGNGGGDSTIAERMLQLFSPKHIDPLADIMKVTAPNFHFMKSVYPNDEFTNALLEAQRRGQSYTRPLPLISEEMVNDLGQFYFKPVAVFTDGYCYSSCDMLAAQMQDHGLATIFGERETTGAGGANVFRLSKFLQDLGNNPGPFAPLPAGQDILFAFRQTIRNGLNQGKLIENEGVKTEIINKPTLMDIYEGDVLQLTAIGKYLSQKTLDYTSWVKMTDERQDYVQNEKASIALNWEDTHRIEFANKEKTIGATDVNEDGETVIALPIDTRKVGPGRMALHGSFNEKKVWRKILNYRIVPHAKSMTAPYQLRHQDFSFYTFNSALSEGWQFKKGVMKLAHNFYQGDLHAEASLFIVPQNEMALSFKFEGNTEADCDFFKVSIISNGEETIVLGPLSGKISEQQVKIDLTPYKGQKIEVRYKFDSDEMISFDGVKIQDIKLQ